MPINVDLIRTLRCKLHLTQEQAAKKAGIGGRQHWYRIESGRHRGITVRTLEAMARALGVSPRDLLK